MHSSIATASGAARPNEDFVAITDSVALVLDGATTPGFLDTGCKHGTRWFARALGAEIFIRTSADSERGLAECLAEAIAALAERHATTCDISHPGHPSATVALLKESADEYQYLVLGDSTVALETAAGMKVLTDTRLDEVATDFHHALMAAEHGTPEHAAAFGDLTTALRQHRNRPGGFWIAAVDPGAAYQAVAGSVARSEVRSAAVLSDGASIVADRFQTHSWDRVFEILGTHGPARLIDEVRATELSDPEGQRWPRGKIHDDATVAYCRPQQPEVVS